MRYQLLQTDEYLAWLNTLQRETQIQINARMTRLRNLGHWGHVNLFNGIVELKWKNGLRIYTARYNKQIIVILLGGNKNGQSKDIEKAKRIRDAQFNSLQNR